MPGFDAQNVLSLSVGRLRGWLSSPQRVASRWLGGPALLTACLGLILAVFASPGGVGIQLCWFQGTTGIPCLGCGLTRSMSCGLRGMFWQSFQFHPLGLPILALLMFIVVQRLLPSGWRIRIVRLMEARAILFNGLYLAFLVAFVGFGALRALLHFIGAPRI